MDAIQGLRAVAALLVVVDHSLSILIDKGILASSERVLANLCGGSGVKIFFLISGFIMTVTTFDKFGTGGAPAIFLRKRLSRIVPLYWLTTVIFTLHLMLQGRAPAALFVVLSFCFIPWPDARGVLQPVYGLGWTLNYEMFFYALFAASLVFGAYRGLTVVVGSLLVLVSVVGMGFGGHLHGPLGNIIGYWGNSIVLFFAGGIVLGVLRIRLLDAQRAVRWGARSGLVMAVIGVGGYLGFAAVRPHSDPGLMGMACVCFAAVAFCALASGVTADERRSRPTIYLLGDASYSIYLVHGFLVGPGIYVWMRLVGASWAGGFIATMLVASSIAGVLSYRWVEQPSLRLIRRWI